MIAKILVAKNKQTDDILYTKVLGDEDDGDRYVCLKYPCSLFTIQQLQSALYGWSQSTQKWAEDMYHDSADVVLESQAWDLPSIGDFEVSIITKEITL